MPPPLTSPISLRKNKNVTASALFGVAAIQIIIGTLAYFIYSEELGLLNRIISPSGVFDVALGITAQWLRLSAGIIGAILYAAFPVFQATMDLLMTGLIFKIPIVVLLIVAVISALRHPPSSRHAFQAS